MDKEVLRFKSTKSFSTKEESEADAIMKAKGAIDYHIEHGKWPDWADGGTPERAN